jgi:hypothetical protein
LGTDSSACAAVRKEKIATRKNAEIFFMGTSASQ